MFPTVFQSHEHFSKPLTPYQYFSKEDFSGRIDSKAFSITFWQRSGSVLSEVSFTHNCAVTCSSISQHISSSLCGVIGNIWPKRLSRTGKKFPFAWFHAQKSHWFTWSSERNLWIELWCITSGCRSHSSCNVDFRCGNATWPYALTGKVRLA